jgi:NAD+ synthetase
MKEKIKNIIEKQRQKRNFDVDSYVEEKTFKINSFFREAGLDAAVIGISGGVDSAVAMALLKKAQEDEDSPIKVVRGVVAPIYGDGVTGQDEAAQKAIKMLDEFNCEYSYTDLTDAYDAMVQCKSEGLGEKEAWTNGQMASVLRTPMFYYQAAILQSMGYKSLVVGTTNRDEGSYIGFFGKASDAMVDLQPIADIHKSEVYQVAEALGVPDEIIQATPKGDVWDSRVDEQMIGAPYHFLEDYLLLLEYLGERDVRPDLFIKGAQQHFEEKELRWIHNIEKIHSTNSHKYQVGMPSHFIDVLPRKIPGGWN